MKEHFYGSFTIQEAEDVGKKFKVRCKSNYSYEHCLTIGNEYEIEITPKILTCSPLCCFVGDKGKTGECHLERFEKLPRM